MVTYKEKIIAADDGDLPGMRAFQALAQVGQPRSGIPTLRAAAPPAARNPKMF
jgi:hypothetical protein